MISSERQLYDANPFGIFVIDPNFKGSCTKLAPPIKKGTGFEDNEVIFHGIFRGADGHLVFNSHPQKLST